MSLSAQKGNKIIIRVEGEDDKIFCLLSTGFKQYTSIFENISDEYMRERALDVKHVGDKVLKILKGKSEDYKFAEKILYLL